jgi:hypothetical protein
MKIIILIFILFLTSCKPSDLTKTEDAKSKPNPKWKQFPIMLTFPLLKKGEIEHAVSASVRQYNDAIGFEAFKVEYENYDHSKQIKTEKNRVFFDETYNCHESQSCSRVYMTPVDYEITHADIIFDMRAGSDYDFETALMHQLGHVLGVKHRAYNEDRYSVMNPLSYYALLYSVLTTGDMNLIRGHYH